MGRLWARQQAGLPLCSLARPQASGRLRAHYHCVVCSVTIARKTDMVSHLKRHVNRGETEATYSAGSGLRREEPGERAAPCLTRASRLGLSSLGLLLLLCSSVRSGV